MKKNVSKFVAFVMVLVLALGLVACSAEPSKYAGTWSPKQATAQGITMDITALSKDLGDMSIKIENQGSAVLTVDGESATVDMTESDAGIVLSGDNQKMEFKANGGNLEYTDPKTGVILIFSK